MNDMCADCCLLLFTCCIGQLLLPFLLLLYFLSMCCSFVNSVTEQLTGTLSLGAAVFASVLFASGMPTEYDVVSSRFTLYPKVGSLHGLHVSQWTACSCTHSL